ncbi:MAG: hypothetical protein N4A44_03535 [Alphaproteobacteria bacterium]|jgi:hypothetical protein|nr:hypothetical protein [Alphaproteobacteria bacterium]
MLDILDFENNVEYLPIAIEVIEVRTIDYSLISDLSDFERAPIVN